MKKASSVVVALQIIASLSVNVNAMHLESLERRAAQTNAICSTDFAWADTSKKKSPCQVAAETMAPCNGGNWIVPALQSTQNYDPPNSTTANICSCSWTVYNLLMACSDCQGIPQAVKGWPFYSNQCPGQFLGNTTYYPPSLLPDDVQIPAWATTNPTQWDNSQYNTVQAKAIAQQGNPDVGNPPVVVKKSSVGPIVGGVIGGLVAVGLAAGIAYYLLRKHRQRAKKIPLDPSEKGHNRGPSDTTMTSLGYTSYTSSSPGPGYSNGAPTIRTHVTSLNNFSVMGAQPNGNTIYTTAPSPPPAANRATPPNPEDVVVPYTLQRAGTTASPSSLDRKSPNGPVARYDSPNAPPAMGNDALFETPGRPRVNPPAYTAHDNSTPSSSSQVLAQTRRRQGHAHNSSDADLSYASYNQGTSTPYRSGNSNPEDNSDIFTTLPNEGGSVAAGTTLTRTGSGAAQTSYTSPSSYPRDVKRRPTDDSVNIG